MILGSKQKTEADVINTFRDVVEVEFQIQAQRFEHVRGAAG